MILNLLLVVVLAVPAVPSSAAWDKLPEKWDLADVYRILEDSPWSPAATKVEAKGAPRLEDSQTGRATDSPIDSSDSQLVPGVELSRSRSRSGIPVIWWSSKAIRLAELRLRELRTANRSSEPLKVEELPDYVLVLEGPEPVRILQDAKEDLHDTVFLELPEGTTIDLTSVLFLEGTEEQDTRVEFHFPRQVDGVATLDPNAERVILHCKATAKSPRPFQENTVSLRAEFHPRSMRVRGVPDL